MQSTSSNGSRSGARRGESSSSLQDAVMAASQQASGVQPSPSTTSSNARNSSSSRSARRIQSSSQQLSQIERSVTHLLVATKQLLETLTQWSRRSATENEVSDVYVRLGYEFNIACRAFTSIGVETTDLGNVPDELRKILEETLSQDASPASLDQYLPKIRDIIINLLHGLKKKQAKLRQRQANQSGVGVPGAGSSARTDSMMSSTPSQASGITQVLDDAQTRYNAEPAEASPGFPIQGSKDPQPVPPRTSSSVRRDPNSRKNSRHDVSTSSTATTAPPSSYNAPSRHVRSDLPPIPTFSEPESNPQRNGTNSNSLYPPVPPEPPQDDALSALARGGDLERRASRRYSAYHVSKYLNTGPNGVPTMPPPQSSPVPNRGREVRESLNAVRVRNSVVHSRTRSGHRLNDPSPARSIRTNGTSDIPIYPTVKSKFHEPSNEDIIDSPTINTPSGAAESAYKFPPSQATNHLGPIREVSNPDTRGGRRDGSPSTTMLKGRLAQQLATASATNTQSSSPTLEQTQQFIPEDSPQPGKELTLFLQYKSRIKKFTLPEGSSDLSIARLQLAFIEKFAWNTHTNGDLPEIYLQDSVSGVRHELDDLNDVKDRSVLVLNVEPLDEVRRHFDEGLSGMQQSILESVRSMADSQKLTLQKMQDGQQNTTRDISRLLSMPPPAVTHSGSPSVSSFGSHVRSSPSLSKRNQMNEVKGLKRDLAVMRQTYNAFVAEVEKSMTAVKETAGKVKATAALSSAGMSGGSDAEGRVYVNGGKKALAADSDRLVSRVDDLQDTVEDLRKDVVMRGVRPRPRQLEEVSKDISIATAELKKMQEYLRREKPVWTKIWEKELDTVCMDRDLLTMQEELAADLEDDLEKAGQTFALVEQCTKEQLKDAGGGNPAQGGIPNGLNAPLGTPRSTSRGYASNVDPHAAKEGMLDEVRALQPNHDVRIEAIERAEKLRKRELEDRKDGAFQKELGKFVGEGKLKKSGGVDELERQRVAKDDAIRKEVWERMNGMVPNTDVPSVSVESAEDEGNLTDFAMSEEGTGTEDRSRAASAVRSQSGEQVFVDAAEMSPEEAALMAQEQITPRGALPPPEEQIPLPR